MGELKDPEILGMFWKKELNPVFKDASYIILLETACTEYPFIFYGEELGFGGNVGFTVHRLKRLAEIFRLPFDKSTAFEMYDSFAEKKIVRAVPRLKRTKEYTLYTITEEGKKASRETLQALQKINGIHKAWEAGKNVVLERMPSWEEVGEEDYMRYWGEIGRIWDVAADWKSVFEMFYEEARARFYEKVARKIEERRLKEAPGKE